MKKSDRGLLIVAKTNIQVAKRDIREADEVYVNFVLFNITQAVEKTIKFLCSCYGIDYDYGHNKIPLRGGVPEGRGGFTGFCRRLRKMGHKIQIHRQPISAAQLCRKTHSVYFCMD